MIRFAAQQRRRIFAFARRAWLQQGSTAIWLSGIVGGCLGALVFFDSGSLTTVANLPDLIPVTPDGMVSAHDRSGVILPMASYLLTMTPGLLGTLVAIVATLTLPGVVANDVRGGGIEVLLASPVPRAHLFVSYLGAALILTSVSWLIATSAFAAVGVISAATAGISVSLSLGYSLALLVLPLSMGVWSATVTLFGALLYPRSLDSAAGMNGGPIRLAALLPTLIVVPAVLLLPRLVLPTLAFILSLTLLASFAIVSFTARGFRSTRVLGN